LLRLRVVVLSEVLVVSADSEDVVLEEAALTPIPQETRTSIGLSVFRVELRGAVHHLRMTGLSVAIKIVKNSANEIRTIVNGGGRCAAEIQTITVDANGWPMSAC